MISGGQVIDMIEWFSIWLSLSWSKEIGLLFGLCRKRKCRKMYDFSTRLFLPCSALSYAMLLNNAILTIIVLTCLKINKQVKEEP